MKLGLFLSKGYFPKELPPPFHSTDFGSKARSLLAKKAYYSSAPGESLAVIYSLRKNGVMRRHLGIPHPKQFLELAQAMLNNWTLLTRSCKASPYSESLPVVNGAKRALRTKSKSLNNFRFDLINKSFGKSHELRIDISQFYPSIYTHSITWAIMGKPDAKEYFRKKKKRRSWANLLATDPKAKLYEYCDELDTLVRNCQERQSVGLPIGPDSSFLLAEVLGSRVDTEIHRSLPDVTGTRYFDDYYFFVDSKGEAEKVLKIVQRVLSEYKLEINESKISINESPFAFEYPWANLLSMYRFRSIDKYELRTFFDIVIRLLKDYPNESSQIVHYSLLRFEYGNVPIAQPNFGIFVKLCLSLILRDSSNLDQFLKILLSYKTLLTPPIKKLIRPVLEGILEENAKVSHSFEVSWALWCFISLNIRCQSALVQTILDSTDDIPRLIALDLVSRNLYAGTRPKTAYIYSSLSPADLYGDHWLFAYESVKKGWLPEQEVPS